MSKKSLKQIPNGRFFPQQQNAMGSLHYIDLGVFWASWGGSGGFKEPVLGDRSCGSGEPVPGTGSGFRWVPTGFAVPRNRVPDTKVLGSEGCVPEGSKVLAFDGFRRVRFCCSRGLDGTGSGNQVPETRGIKKVLSSGDSVPEVPKVTLYFESFTFVLGKYTFVLWKYAFVLWSILLYLYFESILLYFESILLYFESILLYFESLLLYFESILL